MKNDKLFIEQFESKVVKGLFFGVMLINKDTAKKALTHRSQTMPSDEIHSNSVKQSILSNGYSQSFPIVFDSNMKTLDGFTRLTASIELVEDGLVDEIAIPFYTANNISDGCAFNSASRGASPEDIAYLFKLPKKRGVFTGTSLRAAEQCVEASQMLDVAKMPEKGDAAYYNAFKSCRIQRHTSKIVREKETFINAYEATCEICNELGLKPDSIKFAHWIAMFCRYGVSSTTKAIARKHPMVIKGSTQKARYELFVKCSKEARRLGGL